MSRSKGNSWRKARNAGAVAALVVLSTLITAGPAAAHPGTYCGHSTSRHASWFGWMPLWHTVEWKSGYVDRYTQQHKHVVKVTDPFGSYYAHKVC